MYSYDRRNFRAASEALPKDTELSVLLRKGSWPSDMFNRGSILTVTDGGNVGSTLKLKMKGQVMGGPYDFKVVSEKDGVYTLVSSNDRFLRGLKVKILDSKTAAEDNTWGRGNVPLPTKLSGLGRYVAALAPGKILSHKAFPDDFVHMLTVKVSHSLSMMVEDNKTLIRLGLLRIQCNDPGTLSFYFQGEPADFAQLGTG